MEGRRDERNLYGGLGLEFVGYWNSRGCRATGSGVVNPSRQERVLMTLPASLPPDIQVAKTHGLTLNLSLRGGCQATAHGHQALDQDFMRQHLQRGAGSPQGLG